MYLYLVINPEIRKSVGEGGEEIGNRDNDNNKKFVRSVDIAYLLQGYVREGSLLFTSLSLVFVKSS